MRNMIIASTSKLHGQMPLFYLQDALAELYAGREEILFVPFARPGGIDHTAYTESVRKAFEPLSLNLRGLHECADPVAALETAQGIFTGGGNTFVLLNTLKKSSLLAPLKRAIDRGTPYLGTSAGSNITGQSIHTTNDMPIVEVESAKAMACLPFNLNPHYLDPDPNSTHQGETRETRLKEYLAFNDTPVIGLREGSWLRVKGSSIALCGSLSARVFTSEKAPFEVEPGELEKFW